ncbi:uncharacterized protein LOC124271136 [Haliotis rubra]|uniref:uncharacterized protein LOC124271136 n=1 Tax=Haliotis rubra TaxID=36100 RepID=UPI001EE62B5B|nr:uncharacterized protein LOC124271136 [Haliotis rubra]
MYLRPLVKPRDGQWYSQQVVGKHTLQQTVGKMCKQAGFEGFYSNHSLRATCATRLFQSGIDEQLITRTTGHRSTAVREYNRVSTAQEKELSNVIQGGGELPKRRRTADSSVNVATTTTPAVSQSVTDDRVAISVSVVIKK